MQQNLDELKNKTKNNDEFCLLNEVCLIPKKEETKARFFTRIEEEFPKELLEENKKGSFLRKEILSHLQIDIDYLPWEISGKGLKPWHLGVFETDGKTHRIQIHPQAERKGKLFEVLSHEAIHYLRRDYESPYEEALCYLASKRALYRTLGFFLVSMEFKIAFILSILFTMMTFALEFSSWILRILTLASPFLFVGAFALCFFRKKAPYLLFKKLSSKIQSPLSLLVRLDPKEIDLLSKDLDPIATMQTWSLDSFRWKFLTSIYLKDR